VFDSLHFDITAENRINNFIQDMRVFNLGLDQDLLSLGPLGLNIVLPEVTFLLGALATLVGTRALEITVICKSDKVFSKPFKTLPRLTKQVRV
jgi:hypothetical protein